VIAIVTISSFDGDLKVKSGTGTQSRLYPNATAMAFNNFFANGQPHARAGIFIASVQSLENHKNSIVELRIDPNPIVTYRE
jgi:hypothetical protein